MKKYFILINHYLSSFWFILLLLTIGGLIMILFNPISLVIYFGKNGEFSAISIIIWRFLVSFLLPLAAISTILAIIIWIKDKREHSYKGFVSLLVILLALGFLFLFDLKLTALSRNIVDGRFDVVLGNLTTADRNKNLYKTIQYKENIIPEANTQIEKLLNIPAEIKNIYSKDNVTYLSIDILDRNSEFIPGKNSFFVNTDKKIQNVSIDKNTKVYICGPSSDNNVSTADEQTEITGVLKYIQSLLLLNEPAIYYFDIENNIVQTIYQQCLP